MHVSSRDRHALPGQGGAAASGARLAVDCSSKKLLVRGEASCCDKQVFSDFVAQVSFGKFRIYMAVTAVTCDATGNVIIQHQGLFRVRDCAHGGPQRSRHIALTSH